MIELSANPFAKAMQKYHVAKLMSRAAQASFFVLHAGISAQHVRERHSAGV
jgi:hypothetical protein